MPKELVFKKYQIRAEHIRTKEQRNIQVECTDIGHVHIAFGKRGWVITKHYEIHQDNKEVITC